MTPTQQNTTNLETITRCTVELSTGIDYRTAEALDRIDLVSVAHLLAECADELLHGLVTAARTDGATWQEIGDALGTSRQNVQQRFG